MSQVLQKTRLAALLVATLSLHVFAADSARQIVDESQKRTQAKSQRYEGLLQVFDAKGKICLLYTSPSPRDS